MEVKLPSLSENYDDRPTGQPTDTERRAHREVTLPYMYYIHKICKGQANVLDKPWLPC